MQINDKLKIYLKTAVEQDASDIHFISGAAPVVRIKNDLIPVGKGIIDAAELDEMLMSSMAEENQREFRSRHETDYGLRIPGIGKFRVNAFTALGSPASTMRIIRDGVRNVSQLKLPAQLNNLASLNDGLVLIAGATGSGKSTSLAAMIDYVNQNESKRIITIENPVEIIHTNNKSVISQREVGEDTDTFADALRSMLRQNPDIILIGEIRDKETADAALQAAQTGHLVFSTIHAGTAEETINRFANLYPTEERANVKHNLSFTLKGVLAQRLVVGTQGNRLPILEIMLSTKRIQDSIIADADGLEERESITKIISEGKSYGMQTLDQDLINKVINNIITPQAAIDEAVNELSMRQDLQSRGVQL